jgi:hypothetical protein
MNNTPSMSPMYLFYALLAITMLHLPIYVNILLSVAQYAQPFALEYFKDWLTNRRK